MPPTPPPSAVDALLSAAWADHRAGRLADAERGYRAALAETPGHAAALHLLGVLLCQTNQAESGIDLIRQAARQAPNDAAIHNNLGNALKTLGRTEESIAAFLETLRLKPDYAEGYYNLGNGLMLLERHDAAIAAFRRAVALKPTFAEAQHNLAQALMQTGDWASAQQAAERAAAIKPDDRETAYQAFYLANHLCDWRERAPRIDKLSAIARHPESRLHPFMLLATSDDPTLHLAATRAYARNVIMPRVAPLAPLPQATRGNKLRIAYLSADFCDHATANLMAGLFEAHDRAGFEITAISWSPRDGSAMEARLRRAFDRFIDVHDMDDAAVAALIREQGVDIAVDLKGYTRDARPGILAHRPAALQVAYLGYPGSLGADFIDYALVDAIVAPMEDQALYDEKLVWLPGSYQVNDRARAVAATMPSRATHGLPDGAVVFCSFNASYKLGPLMFDSWMRILGQVPGSVLWLLESHAGVADNLRREAAARGIDPARLIFAKPLPVAEHLARMALADLMLDNLPYNAHTTTSDALWVGLPVLTCKGRSFAARVAASLLTTSGLPELIVEGFGDYEATAVRLATRPDERAALRQRLRNSRDSNPLFETVRFARHLEAAYREMQDIALAGQPPHAFAVSP